MKQCLPELLSDDVSALRGSVGVQALATLCRLVDHAGAFVPLCCQLLQQSVRTHIIQQSFLFPKSLFFSMHSYWTVLLEKKAFVLWTEEQ